jgi:tetratricopeptide (TPR) repeat protein
MTKSFYFYLILLVSCSLCARAPAAESVFQEAMAAIASNDYVKGLNYLELAVRGDPDNLRYASEYRQAAIREKDFDRSLNVFEQLLAGHPASANLHLNYGFAYVDKIPVAGSITQVILANDALKEFSKAVDIQPSWICYYTRGTSYLFWPKVFNKASLGVDDLEKALKIQKLRPLRSYHVRTYVALGDGYWKTDQLDKAHAIWQEGLGQFPDNAQLKSRLSVRGDELKSLIEAGFDPNRRVNTDLREIWQDQQ